MKLLIDPINTNDPQFCSWNWKVHEVVKHLLATREDVFFYYALPEHLGNSARGWSIDQEWLLKDTRVEYLSLPASVDRTREYTRLRPELESWLNFSGNRWDWDVCITGRVPMVPAMQAIAHRPGSTDYANKVFYVVEDMPNMSFKKCVPLSRADIYDRMTLAGYQAADRTFFMSFWEREAALQIGRRELSPSRLRELAPKMVDSSPIKVEDCRVRAPEIVQGIVRRDKPFTIAYTQRFERVHRRSADVMELFERHWIYRSGSQPLRFISTSNSRGTAGLLREGIEFMRPPRAEFHRLMQEEVAVVVVMSIDDAYPLSLIEPLLLGTPCIVLGADYAKATLGTAYPFYVANEVEAYGMAKLFIEDYAGMYAKFAAWVDAQFRPLMLGRNKTWLPVLIEDALNKHEADRKAQPNRTNSIAKLLHEHCGPEFVFMEALEKLGKDGHLRHFDNKIKNNEAYLNASFCTDWFSIKRHLYDLGYQDASITIGHMKVAA